METNSGELFLNEKVAKWWDDNPFTYSFEKNDIQPDEKFFSEINRKFIKWTPWAQNDSRPLSGVIDFESLRGKKILDIAVGTGWSTEQFVRAGARVVAIDISQKAVQLTKKRFEIFGLEKPEVIVADAQELPFDDETFDFVLAWGCLMHMPQTEKAVREIYRVLKHGGRANAMMYNKHSLHWWYYIFLSKGVLRGKLLSMSLQELANRYTDGVYQGGNQLTKFYSKFGIKNLFRNFARLSVSVHDTTTPIDHFPHRSLALGRILPEKIKERLAEKIGQSLWIEAVK